MIATSRMNTFRAHSRGGVGWAIGCPNYVVCFAVRGSRDSKRPGTTVTSAPKY